MVLQKILEHRSIEIIAHKEMPEALIFCGRGFLIQAT